VENIQNVHVKIDKPKEGVIPLTFSKVATVLRFLLDSLNMPVFVHCLDGTVVTGIVIACLRKVQCWGISSIMREYSRYLQIDGEESASADETEFVERFQSEFQLNIARVPNWVVIPPKKHPFLKIKYVREDSQTNSPAVTSKPFPIPSKVSIGRFSVQTSNSEIEALVNNHASYVLASQTLFDSPETNSLINSQANYSHLSSMANTTTSLAFRAEKELLRQRFNDLNASMSRKIIPKEKIHTKQEEKDEQVEKESMTVKALALENTTLERRMY
jgi:hypothetical protein